jgi:hypothetical protein
MKIVVLSSLILLTIIVSISAQTIEGQCFKMLESTPWSQSLIVPDSSLDFKIEAISGVKMKLIQDWNRFTDDNKGEGYKEFEIKVDKNGKFKINFDLVDKSKLIVIEAFRDGYIRLWYSLRMDKFPLTSKVKLILVPLKNVKK